MSKVYSWRKLNEKELTQVYLDEMRRDFPPTELKPLSMILNSEADGTAHTWGVFDGETLAAYLLMVRPAGSRVSQLDYFGTDSFLIGLAGAAAGCGQRGQLEPGMILKQGHKTLPHHTRCTNDTNFILFFHFQHLSFQ